MDNVRGSQAGRGRRGAVRRNAQRLTRTLCLGLTLLAAGALTRSEIAAGAEVRVSPIGVHSMLYLTHPFAAKRAMFEQAAAVGASTIRVDVELSGVFTEPNGPPDWTGVDQYMSLARRYHLRVLADLTATPWYLASCPPGTPSDSTFRCPPGDPGAWAQDAAEIAAHTRGVIDQFEVINEPDGHWSFLGTPQQYAVILSDAYTAIHGADPGAQVVLGGLMNVGAAGMAWLRAVLDVAGADALRRFDIANLHVRGPAADCAGIVRSWRRYFAAVGFNGPLWITETGYPADPAVQTDPAYRGGAAAQARWMTAVVPALLHAGAAMVFVTERDSLTGRFASEGVLQSSDPLTDTPEYSRRPSFYAIRQLADRLTTS
jgi:hypothetical protein